MSAIVVQVELDGQMVDANDATWYQIAPCGCTGGATVVEMPYSGEIRTDGEVAFTEDMTPAERKKTKDQGWTYELGHRTEVVHRMNASCPHEPKWGIEPRPQLDGHIWAASYDSRVLHHVPDETVRTSENHDTFPLSAVKVSALCGSDDYSWSTEWYRVDGKVECKRCLKVLRQAANA